MFPQKLYKLRNEASCSSLNPLIMVQAFTVIILDNYAENDNNIYEIFLIIKY
jgi:hypothetical protein